MYLNNITHSNIQATQWSPQSSVNAPAPHPTFSATAPSTTYAALGQPGDSSIIERAQSAFEAFVQSYKAGGENAARAREAGLGIRQGLDSMEQTRKDDLLLQAVAVALSQLRPSPQSGPGPAAGQSALQAAQVYAGRPSVHQIIGQLGSSAQGYLIDAERAEILSYVSQKIGVDLTNMGSGSAVDSIISLLSESSPARNAGSVAAGTSATAGTVAAEGPAVAGTAAGTASTGSSILGGIGAAYSAYQLIDSWGRSTPQAGAMQGAAVGGYIGSMIVPGVGTLIGAGIGAIAGGLLGSIKAGKHKDQLARDNVRAEWQKAGIIDGDCSLQLADGSRYNIGLDGGHTYENADGTTRRAYDVDFSNPLTGQVIGWAQPMAALLTGGNPKLRSDFTGYLVNAAMSNSPNDLAGAAANLQAIYAKLNVSSEQLVTALQEMAVKGIISRDEFNAYAAGFVSLSRGEQQIEIPAAARPANRSAVPFAQAAA